MAAMTFIVNGVNFYELGASFGGGCPSAGRYYSSDATSGFGPPPLVSSLEFDTRNVEFPGLNGITTKTFGERGLLITGSLIYIGAAKADVEGYLTSDFCLTFPQIARYQITMPGGSIFDGCKLVRGGASIGTWGPAMNAMSVAVVRAVWRQYNVSTYGPNAPS